MKKLTRNTKAMRWLLLALVVLVAISYYTRGFRPDATTLTYPDDEVPALVTSVIDGDTFYVRIEESGLNDKVRVIGIDTPELARGGRKTEPYARKARDRARELLKGKIVTLKLDAANKRNAQGPHRDKYGRLLAHVILPDGRYFSEVMLEQGLGTAIRHFDYDPALKERFMEIESDARKRDAGMWSGK